MWRERHSYRLGRGVRLWELKGRGVVFDPGIHLAFMVWRRLRSPLNFVFRWREPERRRRVGVGGGVIVEQGWCSPLIWEAHVLGQKGEGVIQGGNRECHPIDFLVLLSVACVLFLCKMWRLIGLLLPQVTIEVVDGLEGHEPEKGFRKESKPSWASPNWRNWWPRTSSSSSSSSSTHQTGTRDRTYGGKTADSNFLRPPADWDRKGSKAQTEYGESWFPNCSTAALAAAV